MKRKGSTPRSHLLQRDFLTTCPDVLPHQWIGQVLDTQGHPLYLCTSKTNALEKEKEKGMRGVVAHLDAKYRHTVFVRRGAYVILHSLSDIDTVKSRSPPPIEAFIDHVLFPQHIKVMKKLEQHGLRLIFHVFFLLYNSWKVNDLPHFVYLGNHEVVFSFVNKMEIMKTVHSCLMTLKTKRGFPRSMNVTEF
ncbi:hypothetical protein HMI54_000659 [Coelomomyces lativittatus]|nr:hypothetical protein HMI54_000659 [Coelomomyces lativittatus]